MGVELVTCRSCGAPNHPSRTACGRCREPMPRATDPVFASNDGGAAASASPDDANDETLAHAPVEWSPPHDPDAGDEVDLDATAAQPAVRLAAAAAAMTAPVQAVATADSRTVGARVLELLRGPEPSDTQPLDATATAARLLAPREPGRIPRRSFMVVSVLGLCLGAIVGLAAAQGGFGFGGDEVASGPTFDPGVYRQPPVALAVADVRATSYLPPAGENNYEPELVLDENLATAWNSDGSARADGVGERFTVRLAAPAWITALEFANGYQKDDVRYLANARLARARVTFDRGEEVNLVLLDQGGWQRAPLLDREGLPAPILASSFTIEVVESFPGDTYHDLALSGLHVQGHDALGADRELATRDQS